MQNVRFILETLRRNNGNISQAAIELGRRTNVSAPAAGSAGNHQEGFVCLKRARLIESGCRADTHWTPLDTFPRESQSQGNS